MDPNMKEPLERLAQALHKAIEQSDDVEQALAAIREEGFTAYLLLEVTVALGPRAASEPPTSGDDALQMGFAEVGEKDEWIVEIDGGAGPAASDSLADRVAPDDREFLKSIRIRLD